MRCFKAPWARVVGALAGVGLLLGLVVILIARYLFPVFALPHPGGTQAIGTVTYEWVDNSRSEAFSANPAERRALVVQIWYPAKVDPTTPRAPYVQDAGALGQALARLHNLPAFIFGALDQVRSHAQSAAGVSDAQQAYPVLLFMQGLTGFRQMNTFQIEALVSQGYIVAAVDQPYSAALVVFSDGRRVAGWSKSQMDPLIQQSIAPAVSAPLLHGHALHAGIIPYLAQDASFTLDQLAALNQADPRGILTGRLELHRAGIFGVSLGGLVASQACLQDARFRACLVMDAPTPAPVVKAGLQQPALWITRNVQSMQQEGWGAVDIAQHQNTMHAAFQTLRGGGYFVEVRGMFHANMTDLALWSPALKQLGIVGPIERARAHSIINAYSQAFFDRHLLGRPQSLLDGSPGPYPEVGIEARKPLGSARE